MAPDIRLHLGFAYLSDYSVNYYPGSIIGPNICTKKFDNGQMLLLHSVVSVRLKLLNEGLYEQFKMDAISINMRVCPTLEIICYIV